MLTDAARLWVLQPEAKRHFQRHLFPDGLQLCPEGGLLNQPTSSLFRPLEMPREEMSGAGRPERTELEPAPRLAAQSRAHRRWIHRYRESAIGLY